MVVAYFLDLAVHDFHHLRADRLDSAPFDSRPGEEGFRDSMSAIARTYAQLAMGVRKLSELGLVGAPHFCAASTALAIRADQDRLLVIAGHHPFDVVAV